MSEDNENKPKVVKLGLLYLLKYATFVPLTLYSTVGFQKSAQQIEYWQKQAIEAAKVGSDLPPAASGVKIGLVIIIIVVLTTAALGLVKLLKSLKLIK